MTPTEMTYALWLIVLLLIAIVWGVAYALTIHRDRYNQKVREARKKGNLT